MNIMRNQKGITLVEIIIVIAITGIISSIAAFGVLKFRDSIQYNILLNSIVESTNNVKMKAMTSRLDESDTRISYGIIFFENRYVEFEGDTYVEGADTNVEYQVAIGLRLSSTCSPTDNGTVVFSPITGENTNMCTIYIYRLEQVTQIGNIAISKYGVQQAF